jgi:hypothetical protein
MNSLAVIIHLQVCFEGKQMFKQLKQNNEGSLKRCSVLLTKQNSIQQIAITLT